MAQVVGFFEDEMCKHENITADGYIPGSSAPILRATCDDCAQEMYRKIENGKTSKWTTGAHS
jgi:hypothetical protein